eukprot:CAMPEP_0194038350 /NCGR_PEP_ID=MMETSP0009_2-20130614/10590_1 /TAXON_ID=210454 /ORGANISM="Grammatophora oceanica, Strain CCMP 410" /LENGTH=122 /DNA_ID=CAMNT_0038680813 /DNA_START=39 /DNA_END=404 /DNA_ORIENTATION=+
MECVNNGQQDQDYPRFVYLLTGLEHFPTPTNHYEEPQTTTTAENQECVTTVDALSLRRRQQQEEFEKLRDKGISILGKDSIELQLRSGNLHVGGTDCLHWLQPGIPDFQAKEISDFLRTTLD